MNWQQRAEKAESQIRAFEFSTPRAMTQLQTCESWENTRCGAVWRLLSISKPIVLASALGSPSSQIFWTLILQARLWVFKTLFLKLFSQPCVSKSWQYQLGVRAWGTRSRGNGEKKGAIYTILQNIIPLHNHNSQGHLGTRDEARNHAHIPPLSKSTQPPVAR